jgi:putative tricarboxylic transport membrane protein
LSEVKKLSQTEEFAKERELRGLYPFTLVGKEYQTFMQEEEKKFKALAQEAGLIQ